MSSPTTGKSSRIHPKPCKFFLQGNCKYGDSCKFIHEAVQAGERSATGHAVVPKGGEKVSPSRNKPDPARSKNPCHQWQAVGKCVKGTKCPYRHDPEVKNAIRLRGEANKVQENIRRRNEHEARLETERQQRAVAEALRREREERQKTFLEDLAKEEAVKTIQRVVHEFTVVTFGAGAAIQGILTGFDSCRIRVKNLPSDATLKEVSELFTQQGIDPGRFQIIGMDPVSGGKKEAHVVCPEEARAMAVGLDGIEFRQEALSFEVYQSTGAEGMRALTGTNSPCVLTISWRAPAVGFVVSYVDATQAEAKVRELDGKICAGRRVKVEMNRQPRTGQFLQHLTSNAIVIRGLPPAVTDAQVAKFAGTIALRRLKPTQHDVARVPDLLRRYIDIVSSPLHLSQTSPANTPAGIHTTHARFKDWIAAKLAYDALFQKRFAFIGDAQFQLRLPFPLHYTLMIPLPQYSAQRRRWEALRDGTKGVNGCIMRINPKDRVCIIVVEGEDRKAVGSLKVRVEVLAAGETLQTWHRALGARFLDSVLTTTGAFVRNYWRNRVIKAYGEPGSIDAARAMVAAEVERLGGLEHIVFLKRQSVGFFVRRGIEALKEELGAEIVALDISSRPCKITITGSEVARHALHKLIDESLNNNVAAPAAQDSTCPVCYDAVSVPVQLACGHTYCTPCIRHFLTSAADTKTFPLSCMGDDATCGVPIPLPKVERYLPPDAFKALLETAFFAHVESHPQDFKYCKTPDCGQVYRCSTVATVSHCPACLSTICAACHEDAHAGMTCAEQLVQSDTVLQEQLTDAMATRQGFKKCPTCSVWIEKTEGCNHMTCKCGAHICWVCLGIFTRDTVYEHMQTVHGGIDGPAGGVVEAPEQDAEAQYREQQELLALAARRLALRRELAFRDALVERQRETERLRQVELAERRNREIERQRQMFTRGPAQARMELHRINEAQQQDKGWGCVVM